MTISPARAPYTRGGRRAARGRPDADGQSRVATLDGRPTARCSAEIRSRSPLTPATRHHGRRARDATMHARAVVARLRHEGIETLYKKIDSTLRGHVGAEVRAALGAWQADALAIVASAFPETGRTTIGGRQFVNGVRVEQPSVGSALEAAGIRSEHVDLTVGPGRNRRCGHSGSGGRRVNALVCDAETDDDLDAVVRAGVQSGRTIVWIGSGGLARALATRMGHGLGGQLVAPTSRALLRSNPHRRRECQRGRATSGGARGGLGRLRRGDPPQRARRHERRVPAFSLAAEIEGVLRDRHELVITLGETSARASDDARLAAALGELLNGSRRAGRRTHRDRRRDGDRDPPSVGRDRAAPSGRSRARRSPIGQPRSQAHSGRDQSRIVRNGADADARACSDQAVMTRLVLDREPCICLSSVPRHLEEGTERP